MVNRYPSTLIGELNRLLAPHGQMIDGSVTDDVTDGIAADVSPFHVTRSGPRMHGAFGMLLHVGPRIRAEIETSHNGGKDFSIALSGDPKSDARLIFSKTRDLLQLRKGATANPAGRPLRRLRANPLSAVPNVSHIPEMSNRFVVRSSPPSWLALVTTAVPRDKERLIEGVHSSAVWIDDTLPEGVSVEPQYPPRWTVRTLTWRPHPDFTGTVDVEVWPVYTYDGNEDSERWRRLTVRVRVILKGLKEVLKSINGSGVDEQQFFRRVLESNPLATYEPYILGGYEVTVPVPRQPPVTQRAWAESDRRVRDLPTRQEAQALTDAANALLTSIYDNCENLVATASAAKAGQPAQSRYSVVLTYKGVVLEVVPVETQQEAIDAMTAMQGELRIKTVKGGSSKGAKANPYGRRARR